MKKGDIYIRRNDPDGVVSVAEVVGGQVRYAPEGGGFVHIAPMAKFEGDFRPQTDKDRARLRTAEKGWVAGDWAEDESPIPAWLTKELWNGFAMPAFEKDDLIEAIAKGKILDTFHYAAADVFITLSDCGEPLPVFDPDAEFPRIVEAAADPMFSELEIGGVNLQVDIWPGRNMALADGSSVRVYDVGAGYWTWSREEAPEPAASPAP